MPTAFVAILPLLLGQAEAIPVLDPGVPSRCLERPAGRARVQCDEGSKRCLVAPDAELGPGGERRASLEQVPPCVGEWREEDLVAQGYVLVPAVAETPPGYRRDERQRLMQVNFDLNRRVWLGAGYGAGSFPWSDGGEATFGMRRDVPFRWSGAPALARFRALETFVALDGGMADATLVGVDASRAYPSPFLRLTTFVGKPRRFDPPLYAGAWVEAVRLETLRTESGRWFDRTSIGAAAITFDLWRSKDLSSFVRLRGGAGYETAEQLDGGAVAPLAALDLDVTLDRGGFHHVRLLALAEWVLPADGDFQPTIDPADPSPRRLLPDRRERLTAKAEYEVILLAVNDQPLSLVLDARAARRDDVLDYPTDWRFQGTASLRLNLWAPPRRDAPRQEKL